MPNMKLLVFALLEISNGVPATHSFPVLAVNDFEPVPIATDVALVPVHPSVYEAARAAEAAAALA